MEFGRSERGRQPMKLELFVFGVPDAESPSSVAGRGLIGPANFGKTSSAGQEG